MEIENLFDLETKIIAKRVVFKFVYTEKPITELRMLKTIEMVQKVLETFQEEQINHVSFVFVINKIEMPTNMGLFKNFASTFHSHANIINQKLDFTIIQSKSSIFKLFFSKIEIILIMLVLMNGSCSLSRESVYKEEPKFSFVR